MTPHKCAAQGNAIEISSGPITQSLEALSRQLGIQVLFDADSLKGIKAPGISGYMSAGDALDKLLAGTALQVHRDGDAFLIVLETVPAPTATMNHRNRDSPSSTIQLEEINVTGTHISGQEPVGASLSTYDRDDFDKFGVATVDSLARYMLENFSGADSQATLNTNGNVGSVQQGAGSNIFGGAAFDLLGLGAGATLTLLNGHRIATGGLDGSIVDVSLIPLSMIDHIEILTDGASAIYGSDAVAGVVNIVTRRTLNGAEAGLRYGQSTDKGAGEFTGSQLFGREWSTGNVLLDYEYDDQQGLDASERRWIGLENGPYSLVPENRRQSFSLNGTQQLDDTSFSVVGLYSSREFRMSGLQFSSSNILPNSDTGSGHANLAWTAITVDRDLPAAWHVSSTATYSSMNQWRSGKEYPDGLAGSYFNSALLADSEVAGWDLAGSGHILPLPAGALQLALGGGLRRENYRDSVLSIEPLPTVSQGRTDIDVYGEMIVPILGQALSFPGARRLEMSFAYRLDGYSHLGTAANPKWGWTWEPLVGLTVRGTQGTSFKAPLLSQLDTTSTSYTTALPSSTPGGTPTDALVVSGGNQYLLSEKSKSFTSGIEWSPIRWPQFRGSITYYSIDYNNRIQAQNIEAEPLAVQSQLNSISYVDPTLDQVVPYFQSPGFQKDTAGFGPSGVTAIISNQFANAETTDEQGVRADGRYSYDGGDIGKWSLSLSCNFLLVDRTSIDSGLPPSTNVSSTIGEPPKLRSRAGLDWQHRNLTADLMLNHTSGYQNSLYSPMQNIASWTTADLTLKINFPDSVNSLARGLEMTLNVQNLADRRPPFVSIPAADVAIGRSAVPFDGTNASAIGRYLSLQVRKEW